MNKTVKIVIAVVVVVLILVLLASLMKKKEGYAEVMIAPTYDPFFYSDPSFKSPLTPRFDPYRMGGGNIKSAFPGFDKQAAGLTPLSDSENFEGKIKEGYNEIMIPREGYNDMNKNNK